MIGAVIGDAAVRVACNSLRLRAGDFRQPVSGRAVRVLRVRAAGVFTCPVAHRVVLITGGGTGGLGQAV